MITRYIPESPDTVEVPPNIRQSLLEAVQHVGKGGSLRDMTRLYHDKGVGVAIESTWPKLLEEILVQVGRYPEGSNERKAAVLEVLDRVLSVKAGPHFWPNTKLALLEHIEILSGWEHSHQRRWSKAEPVVLEGGKYYMEMFDEVHQIIGRRTLAEERWDFVTNSCKHPYGDVHSFLRLICLINICDLYLTSPELFPPRMQLFLPESRGYTRFKDWYWRTKPPLRWERIEWFPPNHLCYPNWLAADTVADFSARESPSIETAFESKSDTGDLELLWLGLPFEGQLEIVVETDARFGDVPEVWFEFRSRTFRWINSTPETESLLIVPVLSRSQFEAEEELAFRFLSRLASATGLPIKTGFAVVSSKTFRPVIWQPRRWGGAVYPSSYAHDVRLGEEDVLDMPLALYREGINSASVYYAFLSFYKIVQLAFKEDRVKITSWIEENLSRIRTENVNQWLEESGIVSEGVVDYLFKSGRCAIAHVKGKTVDPDAPADWRRIARDVPIVRGLARLAIESGLFGAAMFISR